MTVPQDKLTQDDSDRLADIIWWIKGRNAAAKDGDGYFELGHEHIESLRRFRIAFDKNKIKEIK